MRNPCMDCDGKMIWNGSEWHQMSRCKDEPYCTEYQRYEAEKEEKAFWQSEKKTCHSEPASFGRKKNKSNPKP